MGLNYLKDIAIIIGAIIALFSFANGILEYIRQGAQKRVEQFVALRRRLKENPAFYEICSLLVYDDILLRDVPAQDKRDFLGLIEEVALLSNSGLIRERFQNHCQRIQEDRLRQTKGCLGDSGESAWVFVQKPWGTNAHHR